MSNKVFIPFLIVALLIIAPTSAIGLPDLQLWIEEGDYDATSETWVTTSENFVLSAFATEPTVDVHLCVALSDELYTLDGNGDVVFEPGTSITIDGVALTEADFVYGLPPISTINPDGGGGDLAPHDVYPSAFAELPLPGDPSIDITAPGVIFNTQPLPNGTFESYQDGYVREFAITDASAGIHFDLYTLDADDRVDKFAPFSHDAETMVPEPSTLTLIGSSLLLLPLGKYFRRKRRG